MKRRPQLATATTAKWKNVTRTEYLAAPQDKRAIRDVGTDRYYYVRTK